MVVIVMLMIIVVGERERLIRTGGNDREEAVTG